MHEDPCTWDLCSILQSSDVEGAVWSTGGSDLNVNLVRFEGENGIDEHVNREVDVLGVVLEGEGVLVVDGRLSRLRAGVAFYIPRGSRRSIRSAGHRVAYLTCHRRRAGLLPSRTRG